ncbi:MAG: quinone-dependent dihydroorotate dehydrogenase [Rhodothermales bacterium]
MTYDRFKSWLFARDAEQAHHLGVRAAKLAQQFTPGYIENTFGFDDDCLRTKVWGLDFANPIGLAAGFDKNAELVRFWEQLGFGFAEVGSVSAQAAKGNPKPRAFRLEDDRALINRMGLNNHGAARVARRLAKLPTTRQMPLGINLAKTHDPAIMGEAGVADFRTSFSLLAPHADYIVLNISCPNTTEGKTFEDPDALEALLDTIQEAKRSMAKRPPILLKLSPPPTTQMVFDSATDAIVDLAHRYRIAGFIATNTASDRDGLTTNTTRLDEIGRGGLSGAPLAERSTHLVRYLYEKTEGQLPIIGVGGVASAEDAYAKIRAGASLVQLYTGLVYEGPGVIKAIKEGLVKMLERDGFQRIGDAVGADVR